MDEYNFIRYIDLQLRYYLGYTSEELAVITDEDWAEAHAMLVDIRQKEAKQKSAG